MKKEIILDTAKSIVTGERYGTPEQNFHTIAKMWSTYLGVQIEPKDVCAMMILLKVARIASGHGKEDNWVDVVGYSCLGGELEEKEGRR